jgi:predicted amidophosphoribosyltransferase
VTPNGLDQLHVLGDYWHRDERRRTDLGMLIHAAKDQQQAAAAERLAEQIVTLAPVVVDSAAPVLVAAVPSNPEPTVHLPGVLAQALAMAGLGDWADDLIERQVSTRSLRDVEPADRLEIARAAGYTVGPIVPGTTVVLVDDVVLTGTTLSHVAGCLRFAGAARVVGVVAARSRRV